MATMAAFQARIHFGHLLDRASRGESIEITRNGKHMATLVPATEVELDARHARAVDQLIAIGRQRRKQGKRITVRELLEWRDEGRK